MQKDYLGDPNTDGIISKWIFLPIHKNIL